MTDDPNKTGNPPLPPVVDRATWQADIDALRVREKAHTREGDAIAAARRKLPMVEVDGNLELLGPNGPVTLLDAFEAMDYSYELMDRTVFGRQEAWEDSPTGWPQHCSMRSGTGWPEWAPVTDEYGGRPIAQ